jgi:sugar lactone lactonase YvrE
VTTTIPSTEVDVLIDLHARLGEGPRWDHRTGVLAWVDILSGLVHQTDPDRGVTTSIPVGTSIGALALYGTDGYLLALRNAFATLAGTEIGVIHRLFDEEDRRTNDGSVDPNVRFLVGSMALDAGPRMGSLYVRDLDGAVRTLFDGVTISNGLAWSADGGTMFYVDSVLQGVDVMDYDLESGAVSRRRRWVDVPEADGIPDGIAMDADGCLWVALYGGGRVRRYSPAGKVIGEVELPVPRVTSCAFGGRELDRLFITTAAAGGPGDGRGPHGALFVVEPGARGRESTVVPGPG